MNIKILFNFATIITTLFVATTIVNAEDIISTSIDKQTNITQSTKTAITESTNLTKSVKPQSEETINNDIKTTTNENEQEDSIQQKQEQTTITQSTKEKAIGADVVGSLKPGQVLVKIVHDELVHLLGDEVSEVDFSKKPTVIMM